MTLNQLYVGSNLARDDVQQTDFGYDVVPRYICNNWDEIAAAQGVGAYPFDAIVIGAGMFCGYAAEKLYRGGAGAALRTLLIDAGAFLLQSHDRAIDAKKDYTVASWVCGSDNVDGPAIWDLCKAMLVARRRSGPHLPRPSGLSKDDERPL